MTIGSATAIEIAEAVATTARRLPGVVDLDGGPFGAVATYGGGRSVRGISISYVDGTVRVTVRVRARFGDQLPDLATELRERTALALAGLRVDRPVVTDIEIVDVVVVDRT